MQKSKKELKKHKAYAQHKTNLVGQGNRLVSTPSHSINTAAKLKHP